MFHPRPFDVSQTGKCYQNTHFACYVVRVTKLGNVTTTGVEHGEYRERKSPWIKYRKNFYCVSWGHEKGVRLTHTEDLGPVIDWKWVPFGVWYQGWCRTYSLYRLERKKISPFAGVQSDRDTINKAYKRLISRIKTNCVTRRPKFPLRSTPFPTEQRIKTIRSLMGENPETGYRYKATI